MRRALFAVLMAGALLFGLVGVATPAGAVGAVDLGASVAGTPASVSPAGGLVHYTVTFTNDGLVPATATVTDSTTNGKLADVNGVSASDDCTVPAVGTENPTISCTLDLAAGASKSIEVVILTPTVAPSQVTNTATAELAPAELDVVDINVANDQSIVTTAVTASTTGSSAFVPEGGTLRFKSHVLTVTDAYNEGVVATMRDAVVTPGTMCGNSPCKSEALHVEFDEDERFAGLTEVDVNFSEDDPCYGLGNGSCFGLWFRKLASDPPEPLLACGQEQANDPCLLRVYKDGRGFHQVVKMETDDPDLMQTVKSLGSQTNG